MGDRIQNGMRRDANTSSGKRILYPHAHRSRHRELGRRVHLQVTPKLSPFMPNRGPRQACDISGLDLQPAELAFAVPLSHRPSQLSR